MADAIARRGSGRTRTSTPPIRQAVLVRSKLEDTFWSFVRTIGEWWPATPFSRGKDQVSSVTFEERVGGRVYETWRDGSTAEWGEVLAWRPPSGFTMTWLITGTPTEVELYFASLGPSLTRVSVEHRGWEALTEEELEAACALPGGYRGGAFEVGWAAILGRFVEASQAS
jgi:hypothetical protein